LPRCCGTAQLALSDAYAHLSPTHLKAAIETVASFGKPAQAIPKTLQVKAEEAPISSGTVTNETITEGTAQEVVEKF
jgi:hypothetical protein